MFHVASKEGDSLIDFGFRISDFEFSETLRETARVHRRCLASRYDVVLNVMAAYLASSRSDGLLIAERGVERFDEVVGFFEDPR
jgi:hypothetical protein